MRIGILTDIHDDIPRLRHALSRLAAARVDQLVVLGDVYDAFIREPRGTQIADMLTAAQAKMIWGNHDFALCRKPPDAAYAIYPQPVLDFLATFEPSCQVENCHFSHVEPWLDLHKREDLWSFNGLPNTAERAARSFAAVPQRFIFLGHFHRWLLTGVSGPIHWDVAAPTSLADQERCLIVVAPLFAGHAAIFDTESCVLTAV
jgi:predicted phosphodiesterase